MPQGIFDSKDGEAVTARTQASGLAAIAGFSDRPDGTGAGVYGESKNKGAGVVGIAKTSGTGMYGESAALEGVVGVSRSPQCAGVAGYSKGPAGTGAGVYGEATNNGPGLCGLARGTGAGVMGLAKGSGVGVYAESGVAEGVAGVSKSPGCAGIAGYSQGANGTGAGVYGEATNKGAGVVGMAKGAGVGVFGESREAEGLLGVTRSAGRAGVAGFSQGVDGIGAGVFGEATNKGAGVVGVSKGSGAAVVGAAKGGGAAGYFEGDVHVTGDVILKNADCAEDFAVAGADVEPGSVVIIDDELQLRLGDLAYDRRVAGVISGAGGYRPGIILDRTSRARPAGRMPLALVGKVFCKVDAAHGEIRVGDLLTTSPTPGHAMRATDGERTPGAVLGKALQAHAAGVGLIAILVSLQ